MRILIQGVAVDSVSPGFFYSRVRWLDGLDLLDRR